MKWTNNVPTIEGLYLLKIPESGDWDFGSVKCRKDTEQSYFESFRYFERPIPIIFSETVWWFGPIPGFTCSP